MGSARSRLLCLQETKAHPDQLNDALASPLGWKVFGPPHSGPDIPAPLLFCKGTPMDVSYGIGIPKFDAEGRMVVTRFKDFTLYNVYFPNGGSGVERHVFKQEFLKRFRSHLQKKLQAERI